jgi:hypothetical protein
VFEDPALVAKHVPAHRAKFFAGALALLQGDGDAAGIEQRKVRLIGIGMLITRFAAASEFERSFLGAHAYAADQAIEDYLVQVAETTLGPLLSEHAALAALLRAESPPR